MGMNPFINRIASYVANEIIIKGLSESKLFQRFALRSQHLVNEHKKTVSNTLDKTFDNISKGTTAASSSNNKSPTPPLRGVRGFISAFWKEIASDLGFRK